MSKRNRWVLGLLCGLAGCTSLRVDPDGDGHREVRVQDACKVNVQLVGDDGDITVDHEPVQTKRCNSGVDKYIVRWKLMNARGYKFDHKNGITFPASKNSESPRQPMCKSGSGDTEVSCQFPEPSTGYKWSYMIKLVRAGHQDKTLDPTVIND